MRILGRNEYQTLLDRSEVLERDRYGDKVLRTDDGLFLKMFRIRRLISSKVLFPESLRFALNAKSLKKRDIATVTVTERVKIPHLKRSGIFYHPIEGRTFRQVAQAGEIDAGLVCRLGEYIAQLHKKGVYFRSLHLGNVILCPDGSMGLIDIADMQASPWPIRMSARIRNFRHLLRYPQDVKVLSEAGIESFVDGYTKDYPQIETKLNSEIKKWL